MAAAIRAVFDTNVVVSALVFGRRLAWLRNAWASSLLVPVICQQTAAELLRVLTYPKFRLAAADQAALLEDYLPYAEIIEIPKQMSDMPVQCRDRDDVVFLVLAIVSHTRLVSGDADLSVLKASAPIEVLSVAELHKLVSG